MREPRRRQRRSESTNFEHMREPRRRQGEHGRRYPQASGHKALRTPSHFVHQEALPSHCRGRAFHKRRSATRNSRRFSHLHPSSEQSPNHHNLRGLSSNLSGLSACAIACHDQNELIRILARAKKKQMQFLQSGGNGCGASLQKRFLISSR